MPRNGGKAWTEEESSFVKDNFNTMTNKQIALAINRPHSTIVGKTREFGLKRIRSINTGDTFGRWTILRLCPEGGKSKDSKYYFCECKCGKIKSISRYTLVNGSSRSCGCLRDEAVSERTILRPGESSYNTLFCMCRNTAQKKGLEFSITKEDHRSIVSGDCKYCGAPPLPYNKYASRDGTTRTNSGPLNKATVEQAWILANTVDRVDSDKGYTKINTVSCCYNCNMMKSDRSVEEFLEHIRNIFTFQETK